MNFHAQNLNEKRGQRKGSMFRNGRWWWHLTNGYKKRHSGPEIRCEWHWRISGPRAMLDIGGGDSDAIGLSLGLGFLTVYLTLIYWPWHLWLTDKTKRKDQKYGNGREIGFYFYHEDWALVFNCWYDPMESHSNDPWWMHNYIHLNDLFLGRPVYSEKTLMTDRCEVPMPEGGYLATVRIFESYWKRSRWPWPKRVIRAEITPDKPIPFPGKGENSWDCGEDATHSMTCVADTPLKAAMSLSESVMRSRLRYGGRTWRPGRV